MIIHFEEGQQKLSKLSPMVIRILPKLLVEKLRKFNFHLGLTLELL